MKTADRKQDHIKICLAQDVEVGSTGLENYHFVHNALPEIDFARIDTSVKFLEKKLSAPILISAMTGGTLKAGRINRNLALAAQKVSVSMGVGSQRIVLEIKKEKLKVKNEVIKTFQVRDVAPDILLFANLGAVQLNYGLGAKECQELVDMIEADGLILHLNSLQEAIQPEGNTNFSGLLVKIERVNKTLSVPMIVKEIGSGISEEVARKLFNAGVRIIDTAGWGGTNWAVIEGKRREVGSEKWEAGKVFSDWGIPTAESIIQCRKVKGLKVIGSGGIRNGIEIAKAIVLGADLVGLALPLLKPATQSAKAVEKKLIQLIQELKITMFCLGAKNISQLKKAQLSLKI